MKIKITRDQWEKIGFKAGFIKIARRKDNNGRPIAFSEKYVLKKKKHGMDDPYFFMNGSLSSPELAMDFKDALQIDGGKLEDIAYDWTRDWVAIAVNTPSAKILFKDIDKTETAKAKTNVKKIAFKTPGTQNQNPDEDNFAVELSGKQKTIGSIKSRINKEIHALGNYFSQIPLSEVFDILKKYNVVPIQEDGTLWSGFVTTQGDCGSEKTTQGPMKFDLAFKTDNGYILSNNVLLMMVCTMASGKLEMVCYIS